MGGSRIPQARGSSFPTPLSLTRPLPALGGEGKGEGGLGRIFSALSGRQGSAEQLASAEMEPNLDRALR